MLLVIPFILLILSCSTRQSTIAYIGTMSGQFTALGISAKNGINMAIDDYNATAKHKLRLISYDDEKSDEKTQNILSDIKKNNDALCIIGPIASSLAASVFSDFENTDLITLTPICNIDEIKDIDDNFFTMNTSFTVSAKEMAFSIINDYYSYDNISVLYNESGNTYYIKFYQTIRDILNSNGYTRVNYVKFAENAEQNYNQYVLQAIASQPKLIVILDSDVGTGLLSQNIKKHDDKVALLGCEAAITPRLIEIGGASVENMRFVSTINLDSKDPQVINFNKTYESLYGTEPNPYAYFGYLSAQTIINAGEGCNFNKKRLKESMLNLKDPKIKSELLFNKFGDIENLPVTIIIKDGTFEKLGFLNNAKKKNKS